MTRALVGLAIIGGLVYGGWSIAAANYRAQHCVLILGHWLSIDPSGRTIKAFCQ